MDAAEHRRAGEVPGAVTASVLPSLECVMGIPGWVKDELVLVSSTELPGLSDSSEAILRISAIFNAIFSEAEGSCCTTGLSLLGSEEP
ncbi:hypothetical protein ASE07_09760 [Noviherbaspirillum sp. Root189]|nr:hypothetical protein ASE07_09760 [Noviherbaspirillum sp. Root189]